MSPKAFRLVDQLSSSEKDKAPRVRETRSPAPNAPKNKVDETSVDLSAFVGTSITEITPMEGGAWVSVTLVTCAMEKGKPIRRHIHLLPEQYGSLSPAVGEVTLAYAETLEGAGKLCDAIRKGMELLGYGAMSRRRLIQKLTVRGFERETAEEAVAYLYDHGAFCEETDALRFAEQGVKKLWGPRRIREDLFARGFDAEAVSVAMESLEDVDFTENCARVISKKYGEIPASPNEKKKMIAALMRLGYTSEQIREAMR